MEVDIMCSTCDDRFAAIYHHLPVVFAIISYHRTNSNYLLPCLNRIYHSFPVCWWEYQLCGFYVRLFFFFGEVPKLGQR